MFDIIQELEERIKGGSSKFQFNGPLPDDKVYLVQRAYGFEFPESYRQFITRFNGGMILEHDPSFYIDMTEDEPDSPKNSSFYLFNLEELLDHYNDLRLDEWLVFSGFDGLYPIIPICRTPSNKLLVIFSARGQRAESPVFMVEKENPQKGFYQVADHFYAFLRDYLQSDGFPKLEPDTTKPTLRQYGDEHNIFSISIEMLTYSDALDKAEAMVSLYPDESWSYFERGRTHRDYGYRNDALKDFTRAIEMDELDPLYYYCRGDLILKYGNPRKALIDMDTAVHLAPDDHLFLNGRAEVFYKLERLQEALRDCNEILDKDFVNQLALMTRYRVYKALGEEAKAAADSDMLDELNRN